MNRWVAVTKFEDRSIIWPRVWRSGVPGARARRELPLATWRLLLSKHGVAKERRASHDTEIGGHIDHSVLLLFMFIDHSHSVPFFCLSVSLVVLQTSFFLLVTLW